VHRNHRAADRGRSLDVDPDGNIYWTGRTSSAGLAYPASCSSNLSQPLYSSKEDAFIAKFDKNGYAKWITYFGGFGDEEVNGIKYYMPECPPALVIISGLTNSKNLPHVPADYPHSTLNGSTSTKFDDAFIAAVEDQDVCLNPQALKFATYLGGEGDEHNHVSLSYGPYVDIGRNMYVSYSTKSRAKEMLDSATNIIGTYNKGCCGGVSNTEAFLEKFYPFDLCRQESFGNNSSTQSPPTTLTVYPSLVSKSFVCKILSEQNEVISIALYDVYGKAIQQKTIELIEGVSELPFDVTSISPGIYLVKSKINGVPITVKIVKE